MTSDVSRRLTAALADRYAIEREVGRGGMATVLLAEDVRHNRKVAIKVLLPELAASVGADRFLAEIETVAGLSHPHVLPLYDSGQADGLLYYVMPYVEGESLRERLDRERQLPVDETIRLAAEIADGLDYAHRHGVIHRDVKPGNIMLSEGHAVLADFGISRAVDAARRRNMTGAGLGMGTPLYSSPEQAAGEPGVDGRSDIYSLGCVVYEMLSGEVPLSGATPQSIQAKRLSETPTSLTLLRETVSPGLDAAVARALARVPADRFANAKAFRDALLAVPPDAMLTPQPTPGSGSASSTFTAQPGARKKWPGLVVVSLVLVAAIVGYVAVSRSKPADEPRVPTAADIMESRQLYLEADAEWKAVQSDRSENGRERRLNAVAILDSATRLDPSNAQAWAALAKRYATLGVQKQLPPDSVWPLVMDPALRAVELDSTLALAHEALAIKYWVFDWQWWKAHDEFVTAVLVDPKSPDAPQRRAEAAHILTDLGWRDSALATIRPALESGQPGVKWKYFHALLHGRYFEATLSESRRLLHEASDPDGFLPVYRVFAITALIELGRFDEAGEALEDAEGLLDPGQVLSAYYYARAGDPGAARAELVDMRATGAVPWPSKEAAVYAWIGDFDRAFELLDAELDRQGFVWFLPSDPSFAPLREDSRFDGLLARMGLECRYYEEGHECFQR